MFRVPSLNAKPSESKESCKAIVLELGIAPVQFRFSLSRQVVIGHRTLHGSPGFATASPAGKGVNRSQAGSFVASAAIWANAYRILVRYGGVREAVNYAPARCGPFISNVAFRVSR